MSSGDYVILCPEELLGPGLHSQQEFAESLTHLNDSFAKRFPNVWEERLSANLLKYKDQLWGADFDCRGITKKLYPKTKSKVA